MIQQNEHILANQTDVLGYHVDRLASEVKKYKDMSINSTDIVRQQGSRIMCLMCTGMLDCFTNEYLTMER